MLRLVAKILATRISRGRLRKLNNEGKAVLSPNSGGKMLASRGAAWRIKLVVGRRREGK